MKTSSAKAKGRRLQQEVCRLLRELGKPYGLVDDDITSRGMGQSGTDAVLSPAARRVFNLAIECKNVQKLNVVTVFLEHFEKYKQDTSLKLLVHSRNHTEPMVTLRLSDFMEIFKNHIISRQPNGASENHDRGTQ